jgi:hypothetical protein
VKRSRPRRLPDVGGLEEIDKAYERKVTPLRGVQLNEEEVMPFV